MSLADQLHTLADQLVCSGGTSFFCNISLVDQLEENVVMLECLVFGALVP